VSVVTVLLKGQVMQVHQAITHCTGTPLNCYSALLLLLLLVLLLPCCRQVVAFEDTVAQVHQAYLFVRLTGAVAVAAAAAGPAALLAAGGGV
jgi:hypothetical protein